MGVVTRVSGCVSLIATSVTRVGTPETLEPREVSRGTVTTVVTPRVGTSTSHPQSGGRVRDGTRPPYPSWTTSSTFLGQTMLPVSGPRHGPGGRPTSGGVAGGPDTPTVVTFSSYRPATCPIRGLLFLTFPSN